MTAEAASAQARALIGVRRRVFSARALPVAAFDLLSGLSCLVYLWQRSRDGESSP